MLTINQQIKTYTPYKTSPHQPITKTIVSNVHFGQEIPLFDWISTLENNKPITSIEKLKNKKRPPSRESTIKKINDVYDNYKKSLDEISTDDIKNTVDNIEQTTNYSRGEILSAIQKATQFGNIKSLDKIGKTLDKNDVKVIVNNDKWFSESIKDKKYKNCVENNFGLNSTLDYLFNRKYLYNLKNNIQNQAIFIDNNKLEQLETIKKTDKSSFENLKKDKNIKFFILSGFNNGINFLNRSKDLETRTKEILAQKDIDEETIERTNKLGIDPIIIKNKNPATIENIYNQLRPEQISKNELTAIIDATVMSTKDTLEKQIEFKKPIIQYLENTLDVYPPERLSKSLQNIHQEITEYMKKQGKTNSDILYCIPTSGKSYEYINSQYQQINNIPKEKFVYFNSDGIPPKTKNKTIVILDDCSISGHSLKQAITPIYENMYYYPKNNENTDIIVAPVYCSKFAEETIENTMKINNRESKDKLIITNMNNKKWDTNIETQNNMDDINKLIGDCCFDYDNEEEMPCIIFPYMCPDNNTELAANIAVYHSPIFRKEQNLNNFDLSANIKSYSENTETIAKLAEELLKN